MIKGLLLWRQVLPGKAKGVLARGIRTAHCFADRAGRLEAEESRQRALGAARCACRQLFPCTPSHERLS